MFDLSICQELFDRDPVRYIDMTEAVRRGIGTVLYASPSAALVDVPSPEQPDGFHTYLMCCAGLEEAQHLCGLLPSGGGFLLAAHEDFCVPLLKERFGATLFLEGASYQAAYLRTQPPVLQDCGLAIRQLDVSGLPQVAAHYQLEGEDYLRSLLERGQLFGGFLNGVMVGFAGRHTEGSIGLLEILPQYRRQGFATALEQYMIRLELSLCHIPFGQVLTDNAPSLALQRSLGMTISSGTLHWLSCD
jgi:tRNA (guanine37-N1)-methyltransferase